MALATTTLASAVAVTDKFITVASATSVAVGRIVLIDGEQMEVTKAYVVAETKVPVLRGRGGTATSAHATSANVVHGLAQDFNLPGVGVSVSYPPAGRSRSVVSYSAAGAIALPNAGSDTVAILNGTGALAMTLAVPTKALDGCELIIVANGKAAHTVTLATAIGDAGAGYTVLTFAAGGQVACRFIAANGIWCAPGAPAFAGTATNLLATLS